MRFDGFNLVVSDMAAAVDFFELLGLEVADTLPEWRDHHRTVEVGDGFDLDLDSEVFAAQWNRGWPGGAGGMGVLGFRVESRDEVDEIVARVTAAGHGVQQEPYDAFWGARYAVVSSPDGHAIGIMSPADDSMRSMPTPPT